MNLSWVENLYEVGSPIRDGARSIARKMAFENERHAKCLSDIAEEAERIERDIARLWTQEEIAAAKRGVMLARGIECVR